MTVTVNVGSSPAALNPDFGGGNITFTGMNGGVNFPANSTAVIGISAAAFLLNTATVHLVSSSGPTMSLGVDFDISPSGGALFYYDLSSSLVDTVVIVNGGNASWIVSCAWYLTGAATGGPSNTGTFVSSGAGPVATAVTTSSGGGAIACAASWSAATYTPSWTNATGDFSNASNNNVQIAGAHSTTSGTQTITDGNAPAFGATGMGLAAWAASSSAPAVFATAGAPLIFMRDWPKKLLKPRRRILKPAYVL